MRENSVNKVKGIILVVVGICWLAFVYYFDALIGKKTAFGTKAQFCFIAGVITVVNGVRIFRRK